MLIRRTLLFLAVSLAVQIACLAQIAAVPDWQKAAGGKMSFDVSSVKQLRPGDPSTKNMFEVNAEDEFAPTGGYFKADARTIMYIIFAYKIVDTSQYWSLVHQLPKWGNTDEFVVEARAEGNPTKNQYRLMMQSLLADRFKLAIHTESRQGPIYALVLNKPGKLGPQLQPHPADAPCPIQSEQTEPSASSSAPTVYCGMLQRSFANGQLHMKMMDVTMEQIANYLSGMDFSLGGLGGMDHLPIIDRTGISGKFDFSIEFALPVVPSTSGTQTASEVIGPTIVEALVGQLGLKLVKQTGPVDVYTIDHIERPSEN
jgi:bla regulator protein blaR1